MRIMIIGFWHLCRVCQHKSPSIVEVLAIACLCSQHTTNGTCQSKESMHKILVLVIRWAKLAIFSKKTKAFHLFFTSTLRQSLCFFQHIYEDGWKWELSLPKTTPVYRRIKHHLNLNLHLALWGCCMLLGRIKNVAHQRMNLTKKDGWASDELPLYYVRVYMRTHTRDVVKFDHSTTRIR